MSGKRFAPREARSSSSPLGPLNRRAGQQFTLARCTTYTVDIYSMLQRNDHTPLVPLPQVEC
jgi:hypothetical protein